MSTLGLPATELRTERTAKAFAMLPQDVAERIAREARARHWQPRVLPMDAYDVQKLPEEEQAIMIASTTGQVLNHAFMKLHCAAVWHAPTSSVRALHS